MQNGMNVVINSNVVKRVGLKSAVFLSMLPNAPLDTQFHEPKGGWHLITYETYFRYFDLMSIDDFRMVITDLKLRGAILAEYHGDGHYFPHYFFPVSVYLTKMGMSLSKAWDD